MTLTCGCDGDYVEIPEEFSASWGTEFCTECGYGPTAKTFAN